MKYIASKRYYNHRFDFEIGYFIKSPCKECDIYKEFPECADECDILDQIHEILSETISCTRNF